MGSRLYRSRLNLFIWSLVRAEPVPPHAAPLCAPTPAIRTSATQTSATPTSTLPTPTPEGIAQFKALYRKRFGIELDEEQALDLATRYLHLFCLGVNPPPRLVSSPTSSQISGPITGTAAPEAKIKKLKKQKLLAVDSMR